MTLYLISIRALPCAYASVSALQLDSRGDGEIVEATRGLFRLRSTRHDSDDPRLDLCDESLDFSHRSDLWIVLKRLTERVPKNQIGTCTLDLNVQFPVLAVFLAINLVRRSVKGPVGVWVG